MKNLLYYRKKLGITQVQLAEMLHVSQAAVTNWETGKREPDFETLRKLTEILECTADELLGFNVGDESKE